MRRKSRFLTTIFSLMPGAGHMYLGLLNKGISIMITFILGMCIVDIGFIGTFGMFIVVPIFFYSFFDALDIYNKMAMGINIDDSDSVFDLVSFRRRMGYSDTVDQENNEEYMEYKRNLNKRTYSTVGIILVLIGLSGVLNILSNTFGWIGHFIYTVKQYIIPIVFIGLGLYMLRKKTD